MLEFLQTLREEHKDDDSVLIALGEIESELNAKRYGLVWEQHEEAVDVQMRTHIPVFTEDVEREITAVPGGAYNFLLEGDNLHSLRLLEKTHKGRIDVIYIDPPYNTGGKNDFIYDDFRIDANDSYRHSINAREAQRQSEDEQLSFWESETMTQAFDRRIASLQINAVAIGKEIKRLEKELRDVRQAITDSTKTNNDVVNSLYQNVLKYAVELGIGSDTTIAASYLFTSNLKELSGALLHKTVFAFRLAYIIEIERVIGVKLPIILDSPSGKEVDQENITLMMDILKRDFSDHQIIIASIFEYDFKSINVIEIVNRLVEIE